MASDTVAVLALDAADYALAREWRCRNLLLDDNAPLESFSYSIDVPFTPEVWTTVATGEHPRDHGVTGDAQEWDHAALRAASRVTQYLPDSVRSALGQPFRVLGESQTFHTTEFEHPFDAVRYWPGLTDARHLDDMWTWIGRATAGDLGTDEFHDRIEGHTGEELGWLAAAANTPHSACVGVHSHILDAAGHVYSQRPGRLRQVYEWTDRQVGWLRDAVDDLVVLSDHGMQTTVLDDDDPGVHSERALVAATGGVGGGLPRSVFEVRDWLTDVTVDVREEERASSTPMAVDAPVDHLRDLGYLESGGAE